MRLMIPMRARQALDGEYASIEVGADVIVEIPDPPDPAVIERVTEYARKLGLHLAKGTVPYARRLLQYVQDELRKAPPGLPD